MFSSTGLKIPLKWFHRRKNITMIQNLVRKGNGHFLRGRYLKSIRDCWQCWKMNLPNPGREMMIAEKIGGGDWLSCLYYGLVYINDNNIHTVFILLIAQNHKISSGLLLIKKSLRAGREMWLLTVYIIIINYRVLAPQTWWRLHTFLNWRWLCLLTGRCLHNEDFIRSYIILRFGHSAWKRSTTPWSWTLLQPSSGRQIPIDKF